MHRATMTALEVSSSPGALVGGTTGLMFSGDLSGLRTGALVGGLGEGVGELAAGGWRIYRLERQFEEVYTGATYKYKPALKKAIRRVYDEASIENAPTRINPDTGEEEIREISHLIPQRFFKEGSDRAPNIFDTISGSRTAANNRNFGGYRRGDWLFNRPWALKPMWKSEHAIVDFQSGEEAATMLWGLRHYRAMPGQTRQAARGVWKTARRVGQSLVDDPKQ